MLIANMIQYQKKCILVLQRLSDVDPDEWPWDLELVLVNINKLICKLVEGLRFFKAEYNSILDGQKWSKNGPKMVQNDPPISIDRLKETKTRLERVQFRVNGNKKQYARFLI